VLEVYKFECFTTPCEIQLYCDDKNKADTCAKDILVEAKRLEKKYNYFDSNSYLNSINLRKKSTLDIETKTLLQRAKQYYQKSTGLFDITLATIKDIYRQNNTLSSLEKQKEELLKYVGCEHFEIKKEKIYFDNQHTKIDLGGFIKEYSVDRAILIIKKYKIKSALVNFGGDIYALGTKPNGQNFSVGIKDPQNREKQLFTIGLYNQALTTSASYERYIKIENKELSHILSKANYKNEILSATVVSNSCVESGVFSTSFMVDKNIKTVNKKYLIDKNLEIIS